VILGAKMYADKTKQYLCSLFGKSRQAFYDNLHGKDEKQMEHVLVLTLAKEIRKDHKHMGTKKLLFKLQEQLEQHKIKIGRDNFHKLLSEHGMLVRYHSYNPRTTDSNHHYKRLTRWHPGHKTRAHELACQKQSLTGSQRRTSDQSTHALPTTRGHGCFFRQDLILI